MASMLGLRSAGGGGVGAAGRIVGAAGGREGPGPTLPRPEAATSPVGGKAFGEPLSGSHIHICTHCPANCIEHLKKNIC